MSAEQKSLEEIEESLEPERYELEGPPLHSFRLEWTRRGFVGALGAGLSVALLSRSSQARQESGRGRRGGERSPDEIAAWLHIHEDGKVSVFTGKVEVGQNARTSLSQVVADELQVPIDSVAMIMGDTFQVPYDRGTFGSLTTPTMAPQLRRAAAAAMQALKELAATRWNLQAESLQAGEGRIRSGDGSRSASYGELTRGKKLLATIARDQAVHDPSQWKITGRSVHKRNGIDFVTGRHQYASDVRLPGMLYGKVKRPPAYGATLLSADITRAKNMPGVTVVVDGDFIAVAAPSSEEAKKALEAISTDWKKSPQPSRAEIFDYLKEHPVEGRGFGGRSGRETGSIEEGLQAADSRLEKTYTVNYIAHTPLEPRAAVARWEGGQLTVWTGTQRPFGVRDELVEVFGLKPDKVRVIMPDTGSGYGGKHTGEAAIEAARLAKAAGKPVKVVWTREEEFTWAYFRPAGVIEVKSGVRKNGSLTAWEFHNYNSGSSGIQGRYEIDNQKVQFHPADSPLRQGSYRGLAATANHFARESHIDEIAHEIEMDPLEFRLENLQDERQIAVLKAVSERAGWGKRKLPKGHALGLAGGFEKRGYVATCAEIEFDSSTREVLVKKLITAFECGAILNPNQLENQVEGAAMMGIGGALFEAVDFADGKIKNPLLSLYRVPRFRDLPEIETILLDRKDIPSAGAGETPLVCVAPALGNAIFRASGVRLRSLPMLPDGKVPEKA